MKVLARVWAADHHDDKIIVIENLLVTYRRLEQVPVFIYPSLEIECLQ
ncbi:MAG: hypothetical protein U5K38_14785 [Woeseiaceae bacterium]|nr:hypothetical protein [Woeseiaceae bacterium]